MDYISVPVVPELLKAKVSVFAELHRKTRALEELNSELEQRVRERTEELQKSETQFRSLANSIPQLAWMAHADGYIFFAVRLKQADMLTEWIIFIGFVRSKAR